MSFHRAFGGLNGISVSGQGEDIPGEPWQCLLTVGPDGPEYAYCGKTTGFSWSGSVSIAETAAPLLGITSSYGPTYFIILCNAAQGASDFAKKGCKSDINGDDGNGCGDEDYEGSTTSLGVSASLHHVHDGGDVDLEFAHSPYSAIGVSSSVGQSAIGTAAMPPSIPGHGAPGLVFEGVLINPSPPAELSEDVDGYPRECAFRADQIPSGDFRFSGSNSGAHSKVVSGSVRVLAYVPDAPPPPPPPPPPLHDPCQAINWYWQSPIDYLEDWDPADGADGRSDKYLSLSSWAEVGDLEIATLMMYMPSGDIPYLEFGVYSGGVFDNQSDQWTALPGFSANDCYIQSWWRRATAESVARGSVDLNLYNFDAPLNPSGGSSEGGNIFLNSFHTDEEPTITYQQGSSDDSFTTPDSDPARVLHLFFARRPNSMTDAIHTVVIRNSPGEDSLEGIPVGGYNYPGHQWMTSIVRDGRYYNGSYWDDYDAYTMGFYYTNNVPGSTAYDYKGPIKWDLSTSREQYGYTLIPFGAAGGIAQGIKICSGDDDGPLIMFV